MYDVQSLYYTEWIASATRLNSRISTQGAGWACLCSVFYYGKSNTLDHALGDSFS